MTKSIDPQVPLKGSNRTSKSAASWVPLADLAPWDRNPKQHGGWSTTALAEGIRRFGFLVPITARRGDGTIAAGHGRRLAMQALLTEDPDFLPRNAPEGVGPGMVPVMWEDFASDAQMRAFAIADNQHPTNAPIDEDGIAGLLRELDAEGISLDGIGFSDEELEELLAPPEIEASDDDDDVPDVEEGPPDSVVGEVYELGPHRLVCGSCRDPETVDRLLDGESINIGFTSPPYASQRKYDESSGFKPIRPDEFVEWFDAVQASVRKHLAPDGSWFVNIKEHCDDGQRVLYVKDLTLAHVRKWEWAFIDEFCWERGGVPGKWPNRFKNSWEPVFHFALSTTIKLRHEHVKHESGDVIDYSPDNQKTHSGFISGSSGGRRSGMALPSNVLHVHSGPQQIAKDQTKHTATFPVGLPEFFIRAYTDAGDVVYEPFCGSGTTLVAAARNGRRCMGVELSPAYCDLIRRRWTRWATKHGRDPGPGALAPAGEADADGG